MAAHDAARRGTRAHDPIFSATAFERLKRGKQTEVRTTIRRPILRARWFYVKTWERGTCVAAGRPLLARPADEQNRGGLRRPLRDAQARGRGTETKAHPLIPTLGMCDSRGI